MLVRFNNEILRRGIEATQPASLPCEWLDILVDEAEVYLSGRTDRRYIFLALVASRALAQKGGLSDGPAGVYDLAQLDGFVRDYAQDLLQEKALRAQPASRQSV